MKIKIEFDNTKITLSFGAGGVEIDAPVLEGQETRQTTLSEAQWSAYAQGRADERRAIETRLVQAESNARETMGAPLDELINDEFPQFQQLVEISDTIDDDVIIDEPPKVDPVTGNISAHVKSFRLLRRARAPEANERKVYHSSCCGYPNAAMRNGSCKGCR